MPEGMVLVKNGEFEDKAAGRQELHEEIAAWSATDAPLVIHFHGGLVSRKTGIEIAHRLGSEYAEAGGKPLFFVWQSGWDETIKNNLPDILADLLKDASVNRLLRGVLKKALKIVAARLGVKADGVFGAASGGGAGMLTDEEIDETVELRFEALLRSDQAGFVGPDIPGGEPFEVASKAAAEAASHSSRELSEKEEAAQIELLADELDSDAEVQALQGVQGFDLSGWIAAAKVVAAVAIRTYNRFQRRRDHGLYLTALEELLVEIKVANLGRLLEWDRMKEDTEQAFQGTESTHAGTALLKDLAEAFATKPDRRVVLIGHSTGAVYICNFLLSAVHVLPEGAKFDVVFLAPACNFDIFHRTLKEARGLIRKMRIFAMRDEYECSDQVLPPVYTRSLLYLVSGVLESERDEPLVGMQRYFVSEVYEDIEEVSESKRYLASVADWSVFSITGEGIAVGLSSRCESHGDFDDDRTTLDSLKLIVSGW